MAWSAPSNVTTGDLITAATWNQDVVSNPTALLPMAFEYVIDGGTVAIAAGTYADIEVPYKCDLTTVRVVTDQTGCLILDVWKTAYSALPPASASSICSACKPTLTAASGYEDTALTNWTTAIAAGDWLRIRVVSCTSITKATFSARGNRS